MVDESPELVIDEENNSEVETDYLGYKVNIHDIDIKRAVVVETMYE